MRRMLQVHNAIVLDVMLELVNHSEITRNVLLADMRIGHAFGPIHFTV